VKYLEVDPNLFEYYLGKVDQKDFNIDRSYRNKTCYVSRDQNSGFAITNDGMLCHVFSLKSGSGVVAVNKAIQMGANRLSCYNTKLCEYYKKFGFMLAIREDFKGVDKHWMILKRNGPKGGASCVGH